MTPALANHSGYFVLFVVLFFSLRSWSDPCGLQESLSGAKPLRLRYETLEAGYCAPSCVTAADQWKGKDRNRLSKRG